MFEFDRASPQDFPILLYEPDFEWEFIEYAVHCPETMIKVLDVSATAYDFIEMS